MPSNTINTRHRSVWEVRGERREGIDSQFSSCSAPAQGPELKDPLFVGDNIIWWLTVQYRVETALTKPGNFKYSQHHNSTALQHIVI